MALFVAAPAVQTSITTMSESGLIVLSVSAVVLAGFLLIPVTHLAPVPTRRNPRRRAARRQDKPKRRPPGTLHPNHALRAQTALHTGATLGLRRHACATPIPGPPR
jgi:hypothetical protein